MLRNIKIQLELLFTKKEFYLSYLVIFLIAILPFIQECTTAFGNDINSLLPADSFYIGREFTFWSSIVVLILPLIASIPFSDSFYTDKRNGTYLACVLRSSRREYFFSKAIVCFLAGFIIIFVPLAINYILNCIAFPLNSVKDITGQQSWSDAYVRLINEILFPNLFIHHPYLYNLVFLIILSFHSALLSLLTFCLSFFIKKNRLIIIGTIFVVNNIFLISYNLLSNKIYFDFNYNDYIVAFNISDGKNFLFYIAFYMIFILLSIMLLFIKSRESDVLE